MPKRLDIKTILVIGSGPIVIGQACEFDYSGNQACKALRGEGYRVILVNSNPATIMTDIVMADKTYIEPITPETVEKIIAKEKPDALLPTVGGQTALNCGLALERLGILKKYGVQMIGANAEAIEKAEDRKKFNDAMAKIGLEVTRNAVVSSIEESREALKRTGLPAIIRPSFTLGGAGGGIAYTEEEFFKIVENGLFVSPSHTVQIDESILGWKEYEMEVIRDKNDNAIIVCAIENVDPMGVHTGDSVTVAPALTLTDKEYQIMRNASLAVLREIGVETGGSNVQFAVNPKDGRLIVIEMNPRVSRSSALASKATGFPIAKVAALLAVGYTLDEIQNDITKVTPASFEPTIDYIVTKIPRFTFEKFGNSSDRLSSTMKSVGEAMAIGRTFAESVQKALSSMEVGFTGFDEIIIKGVDAKNTTEQNRKVILEELKQLRPNRLLLIAQALRYGISQKEINEVSAYDPWFIQQIANIVAKEEEIKKNPKILENADEMFAIKKMGFSDERLAKLTGKSASDIFKTRKTLGVTPVFKRIDTCSAEFVSNTSYMYSCYEGNSLTKAECEADVSDRKKVIILGSGPNRIGQGIEFDYSCVQAAFAVSAAGFESIMVNCNPETVSTDYDTSDRLYFEPMTGESLLAIVEKEQQKGELLGVIVQFGGQTALKLAKTLHENNIPILGTSFDSIDLAEDRERFQQLLHKINLKQPRNTICHRVEEIEDAIAKIGYPVVIRPSNILGGRAMAILHDGNNLETYIKHNASLILDGPILVDKFLQNAIEIDVDLICDGITTEIVGIMEHIEEAGIHSGDSACSIPPYSLSNESIANIKEASILLAKAIDVQGMLNIQFAIQKNDLQNDELFVIEANPRASRTVPFVVKATGVDVVKIATSVLIGKKLSNFPTKYNMKDGFFAVKEVTIPFPRFEFDILLTPEMHSTGESMGLAKSFEEAFYKAQLGVHPSLKKIESVLITVHNDDKTPKLVELAKKLQSIGVEIYTTPNTGKFLKDSGVNVIALPKFTDEKTQMGELLYKRKVQYVIHTDSETSKSAAIFRREVLMQNIFYTTTMRATEAMVNSLVHLLKQDFEVHALQDSIKK